MSTAPASHLRCCSAPQRYHNAIVDTAHNSSSDHFTDREHVVSVFFDLEKAYATAWKYSKLRELHA